MSGSKDQCGTLQSSWIRQILELKSRRSILKTPILPAVLGTEGKLSVPHREVACVRCPGVFLAPDKRACPINFQVLLWVDLPFLNVFYGLFRIWICEINQIWVTFISRLISFVSIQSKRVCSCSIWQQFSFHFLVLHSVVSSKVSKNNAPTVVKHFGRGNIVTPLPVALH